MYVPAGTPAFAVTRLNRELVKIMQMPDVRTRINAAFGRACRRRRRVLPSDHDRELRRRRQALRLRGAGVPSHQRPVARQNAALVVLVLVAYGCRLWAAAIAALLLVSIRCNARRSP
jgi:hypothetical protein